MFIMKEYSCVSGFGIAGSFVGLEEGVGVCTGMRIGEGERGHVLTVCHDLY
jgi:hypothetical protein